MDKQNVVYLYDGILLSFKKEGYSDGAATRMSLEDIVLSENRPVTKRRGLCDPTPGRYVEQ